MPRLIASSCVHRHSAPSQPLLKRLLVRLVLVLLLPLLVAPVGWHAFATPDVSGSASSTVIACLQVGPEFLSPKINQYTYEQEVWLNWTGTISSAALVGYEFSGSVQGTYGRSIYVNGTKVGGASGQWSDQARCGGFDAELQQWPITDPGILHPGRNIVTISLDPGVSDKGWGLSRVQIEVSGADVEGRHYRQVTVPSSYFNNGGNYRNEGTWTHIMTPSGYRAGEAAPLLITAHGFNSNGLEVLLDYHDAAEARGWLVASADYHGEVWNDFYEDDPITGMPHAGTGRRTLGSRASQWDILDIVNYMQANYSVDPTRIYLVGHSMGGMTALLTGARWTDRFAAIVSDSAPTDLIAWEHETVPDGDEPGITPNASINHDIRTETGTYSQPNHYPAQQRVPTDYPFEYQRRSPVQVVENFKHLPLLILHPSNDTKVHPHQAEDLYLLAGQFQPADLERVYFPGGHGSRINDFANYTLDWLAQHHRTPNDAPQPLDFSLDWSGSHFWIAAQYSSASLTEAHWLRVRDARYDRYAKTIRADVENLRPENGNYPENTRSVPPPKNLNVVLTFDLARTGLPTSGPYTVDLVGKDDASFTQTMANASNGRVSVNVPGGAYIVSLSAGDQPPSTQVLRLRNGSNGYWGAEDTYLTNWSPDGNYGYSQSFSLRVQLQSPAHSGALKYDLSPERSGLPAGAKVRYAVLTLRTIESYANRTLPLQIDALVRPWKALEATWNSAMAGKAWEQPGAEAVPSDRAGRGETRLIYPGTNITNQYGFNVTEFAQEWVANPASNQGVLLRVDLLDGTYMSARDGFSMTTSEYMLSSWRPQLTIIYTTDPYTPTPTDTATPTATPTDTATPTPTPTATATPEAGKIRGTLYMDTNANGARDEGEPGWQGKLIQLKQDGTVLNNCSTDGGGRYEFALVSPGMWQVYAKDIPSMYWITTGQNPAHVMVSIGSEYTVDFGLVNSHEVTPTPSPTPHFTHTTYLPVMLAGSGG